MTQKVFFVLFMAVVLSSSSALAQENGALNQQQPTRYPWSVGAGVGLIAYSSLEGSLGGYRGSSPFGVVLLEKQLSEQWALTFDVSGSYSHRNSPGDSAGSLSSLAFEHRYFANASVGVRWIFNPGGPVEVSGLVSVVGQVDGGKGQYAEYVGDVDSEDDYVNLDREVSTVSLGGSIGIAFERKLIDHLFLRFQTSLLQGYWGRDKETMELVDGTDETDKASLFNIGLAFTPAIQLRLEI